MEKTGSTNKRGSFRFPWQRKQSESLCNEWVKAVNMAEVVNKRAITVPKAKVSALQGHLRLPPGIQELPEYDSCVTTEAPFGTYMGRHFISGRARIQGGVYRAASNQEVIEVVDYKDSLAEFYNSLVLRFARERESTRDEEALFCNEISSHIHGVLGPCREVVSLGVFVESRVGATRHHALAAAYLFERAIEGGLLEGSLYFDNGVRPSGLQDERVIYIGKSGYRFTFETKAVIFPYENLILE